MDTLLVIHRALMIFSWMGISLATYGIRWTLSKIKGRPQQEREALFASQVLSLFRRLGATFIKIGQIMSTRPDLFSPTLIETLTHLQDNVGPFSFDKVKETIEVDLGAPLDSIFQTFETMPIASASVAQVHKAHLPDGTAVAVKVQRPRMKELCIFDLAVMRIYARVLNRIPSLSYLAPLESFNQFAQAIKLQLDFTIEARNNHRFRQNFSDNHDVIFPQLYPSLCSRRLLTMQFIEGHKILDVHTGKGDRKHLGKLGFQLMLKMVFQDGFIHADLHPGNILVTKDQKLALLDLGLVAELDTYYRVIFLHYFAAWAQGDGKTMARILLENSPAHHCKSPQAFTQAVEDFVHSFHGKKLGEVQVVGVVFKMLQILRTFRVRVNPIFTMVNLAIALTEGIGKQLDPELDLLKEALPFFTTGSGRI